MRWSFALVAMAALRAGRSVAQECPAEELGPRAVCGSIRVFENRVTKTGRQLDVHYVVLKAESQTDAAPWFFFAGGPGGAGSEMAGLANGAFPEIRKTRDVVLVDQRGTGRSNPLICPTDAAARPAVAFGHVFDPAVMRACRANLESRADLTLYLTATAVEDIDDIRQALGYPRIMVLGASYGTRLAQAYLRRFPDRVAAAVLDGVVTFDFAAPSGYAKSAQAALDRVIDDCQAWRSCRDSFPSLAAEFQQLIKRVSAGPVFARVRRAESDSGVTVPVSAGDFGYAVRGILYRAQGARALPGMIHRAASSGDVSEFAQRYWLRVADFSTFADGLHFSIFCAEDVPFITEPDLPALTGGTFLGRYLIDEYRNGCADWPRAPVSERIRDPLVSSSPTLLLSGWFDPVTPSIYADRVGRSLSRSRHLLVRNEAHGSGFGCARPAVLHFLVTGSLEGMPSVCEGVNNLWSTW